MANGLKVLLIAPRGEDLTDQADEVSGIVRDLHGVTPLYGEIRERDILEAIRHGPYDGLIISGHGSEEGIGVADGILTPGIVATYVNRARANWVILNACYSEAAITIILLSTQADVLAARGELSDRDAWRITRMIAQELTSNDGDIRAAFDALLPGQSEHFRFFRNSRRSADDRGEPEEMESPATSRRPESRLETQIEQMREDISKILAKTALMEYQISQLHAYNDRAPRNGNGQMTWAIVIAAVIVAGAVLTSLSLLMLRS